MVIVAPWPEGGGPRRRGRRLRRFHGRRRLTMFRRARHITNILALMLFLGGLPLHAATLHVTKTVDTADGACEADCSLREAIIAANAAGATSTIVLPAGTYILTIAGTGEDAAAKGDLDVTGTLTITGAG